MNNMQLYISDKAKTKNLTIIEKIISVLEKTGKVIVVGRDANHGAKQIRDDGIIVSDDCHVNVCRIFGSTPNR